MGGRRARAARARRGWAPRARLCVAGGRSRWGPPLRCSFVYVHAAARVQCRTVFSVELWDAFRRQFAEVVMQDEALPLGTCANESPKQAGTSLIGTMRRTAMKIHSHGETCGPDPPRTGLRRIKGRRWH